MKHNKHYVTSYRRTKYRGTSDGTMRKMEELIMASSRVSYALEGQSTTEKEWKKMNSSCDFIAKII
jgi:hypothetical protein